MRNTHISILPTFLVLFITFLVIAVGGKTSSITETPTITVAAAGDAMAQAAILRCARLNDRGQENHDGFDYLYERLRPYVQEADIATVNAEFPSARMRNGREMCLFNAPQGAVEALKWAGFDVVNLANNHSHDQGRAGVGETVGAFERAGLITVGSGRDAREAQRIVAVERNGIWVSRPISGFWP